MPHGLRLSRELSVATMENIKLIRRIAVATAAATALLASALIAPASFADTNTYAAPDAPSFVDASASAKGLKVTWSPVTANPAVTNYVISGGPGTCSVTVPATATSAIVPVLAGTTSVTASVQAVNAYGYSAKDTAPTVSISAGYAPKTYRDVQILQLSDFHGALETTSTNIGAPVLATAFKAERAKVPATVAISSGDMFGAAPPISSQFEELPSVLAMNNIGIDVATFGNHEHDRPLAHLKTMISNSKFKWTVSNYSTLEGVQVTANPVKSFEIINRAGVKIGVVGVNTTDTLDEVFPGNLDFTDDKGKKVSTLITDKIEPVQKAVDAAKKAGANVVVVALHNGWNMDLGANAVGPLIDYSAKLKGVAAVFGGHSHQKYASVINNTAVAEVRNAGVEYTRTQICVDTKTNKVFGSAVDYIDKAAVTAAGYVADDATATLVAGYKSQLNAKMDQKIGQVFDLSPRGGSPAVERSGEAAIGSFTADALKSRYKTDFAIINGGGIRDTLPARTYVPAAGTTYNRPSATNSTGPFDVLLGDAYTIFPFGNSVSVVNITGKNLWAALENGVSQYPAAGRWPQVAGIKFTADVTKPAFSRITAVTKADGTPIAADDKVYSVATVDYMVYGGDGYTQFDPSKQQIKDLLVDVFVDALKADVAAGKVSKLVTDGRETVIK